MSLPDIAAETGLYKAPLHVVPAPAPEAKPARRSDVVKRALAAAKAEGRQLSEEFVRKLFELEALALEVAECGGVIPPGVITEAEQIAANVSARAQNIQSLLSK